MVDEGRIDWDDKGLREIFRSILMTTCDIGAITKPWDVSRKVITVSIIYSFYYTHASDLLNCLQEMVIYPREYIHPYQICVLRTMYCLSGYVPNMY
jgi:hypothetical protein